jgi:hypothetical protein
MPVVTVETSVTSYVLAQGGKERMEANLPALSQVLRESGLGDYPPERLSAMVAKEARRLGANERSEKLMARAYTREGSPRDARHRHASAFCPNCGMYKDHVNECHICGWLEMTS